MTEPHNMLIDTDTQQQEAASRQVLRAGHRQRHTSEPAS